MIERENKGLRCVSGPCGGEKKKRKRKKEKTRPETHLGPCGDEKNGEKKENKAQDTSRALWR
jgi:hypothetical protein